MQIVTIQGTALNILRYALGILMMAYGLVKILQIQFVLPPDVYNSQLNQLDGVTLTWAFLGFSSWFSTLLGAFELVPGFFLLFRKTKLLGIILLLPSLLSVFLVNIAYDFLPYMKVLTGTLLLLDLMLLYPHRKILSSFVMNLLFLDSVTWKEAILNVLILVLVTFFIIYHFM